MNDIRLNGKTSPHRFPVRFGLAFLSLLLLGACSSLTGQAQARTLADFTLLAANTSPGNAQAQGMAGYILNSETNMNSVYTRKLNRELLNPANQSMDDGSVIKYQGPPPQPPANNGPYRPQPGNSSGRSEH